MDTADPLIKLTTNTLFRNTTGAAFQYEDRFTQTTLHQVREFAEEWAKGVELKASAQGLTVIYIIENLTIPCQDGIGAVVATTATVYFESPADKALFELSQHGHS